MVDDFWSVEWEPAALDLFRRVKDEASAIGDDYLGTQHLFLAAVAVTPVEQHGIAALNRDSVRSVILTWPRGLGIITLTPWSQTPRFKYAIRQAMERADRESRSASCRDIWYGLLADPESECLRVLRHLGVPIEELRKALT